MGKSIRHKWVKDVFVLPTKQLPLHHIMITCLCNVDPLSSYIDVVKLLFIGAIHYFLNFALKIDCEYSCTHNLCFEQKRKNITIFHLKIIVFAAVKNCSIQHRRVIVMKSFESVNG